MPEKSSPAAIIKKIKSLPECPACVLIVGPDEVRRARAEGSILNNFLKPEKSGCPNLALERLDGRNLDANRIKRLKEDLTSQSLFAPVRYFVLRWVDELSAELQKQLLAAVENLRGGSKLILSAKQLPANNALRKFMSGKELLIELPELEGNDLARWTEKELRDNGLTEIEPGLADELINIAENSADRISQMAEQLALYCSGSNAARKDLRELFIAQSAPGEYDFIDSLNQGKALRAEQQLSELLASGKNPFLLMSLISRSYSSYLALRALLSSGLSPEAARERLHITPWVFRKQLAAAQAHTLEKLELIMKFIVRADSKLKNRSLGNEAIFSELISGIASPR